ncbi:MAG: hypothetical protein JWR72_3121 [Flavisolibacter sp.]|jgi:hypothetical protein|nr:hypothetical protein [Flavisolibacter sp.]
MSSYVSLFLKTLFNKLPSIAPPFFKTLFACVKGITIILLLNALPVLAVAQEQSLNYSINRHGKQVGKLNFKQVKLGSKTTYAIESDVKASMILSFHVQVKENSVYENDVLQYSSLNRQVNGKERANQQIKNNGTGLSVTEDGEETILKNFVVKYNTHCLYAQEPTFYTSVFSDNYKLFIPIKKIKEHHYKISFPDGNSNEYVYENGSCKLIKVRTSLFNADFVLNKP